MSANGDDQFGHFFQNVDLVEAVDFMARRYHKLPHEILREISVSDFNLNLVIMVLSIRRENDRQKGQREKKGLGGLGFKVNRVPAGSRTR